MKFPTLSRNFAFGLAIGSLIGIGLLVGFTLVFVAFPIVGYALYLAFIAFGLFASRIVRKLLRGEEKTRRFEFVNGMTNGTFLPFLFLLAGVVVYWSYLLVLHFL